MFIGFITQEPLSPKLVEASPFRSSVLRNGLVPCRFSRRCTGGTKPGVVPLAASPRRRCTKWPCPTDFFKGPCLLKFRFGVLSALRSMAWCDHCSGMMMRNSTGTDDHVVMRCVSLIGDMSHVPTGCNLVVCYHSISWLDNTLQPHAELTCIYIYTYYETYYETYSSG